MATFHHLSTSHGFRCIQVVQNISKWACPDMFAYILLMHLVKCLAPERNIDFESLQMPKSR